MNIVPHIDIVGDERIREVLEQDGNYIFEGMRCEAIDGWAPDIGLTDYAHLFGRSIFRPSSVVRAGFPSTIRHRRFSNARNTGDGFFTGTGYIGVVLYDAAGEECPLEFQLRDEPIGRVEPERHDNRRHLIVVDKPVEFIGQMEVFHVRAPGKGAYRIEAFAFLRRRPEPSTFTPYFSRLSARIARRAPGELLGQVHLVTSEAAACVVEVLGESGDSEILVHSEQPARLHAVDVPGLLANRRYRLRVTATEQGGGTASDTVVLSTEQPRLQLGAAVTVPVEIIELTGAKLDGLPLTFGVPLPRGAAGELTSCRLRSGGHEQPAQARVHSRWPDGSAKWMLIDTPAPATLTPYSRIAAHVIVDSNATPPASSLRWAENDGQISVTSDKLRLSVRSSADGLRITIEQRDADGPWRVALEQAADLTITLGNGLELTAAAPDRLELEEAGAERAVIHCRVPHSDSAGVVHLSSSIRLHIYERQPFVKLVHRLEVVSPALAPSVGGPIAELPTELEPVREALAGQAGEAASLLTLRSAVLRLRLPGDKRVHWLGAGETVASGQSWALRHEHDQAHHVLAGERSQLHQGRTPGHVLVEYDGGSLGIAVRHFWETYPKGIRIDRDRITIELLPELSDEPMPGDDDAWHRLFFWRQDRRYKLKTGMAFTNEVLLAFDSPTSEPQAMDTLFAWFEQPPTVRPAIEWLNETRALSAIAPKANSSLPRYEAMVDGAYQTWLADREQLRQYGFINFGDWYGETQWSWGNNEYDAPFAHYCEFLRGGEPGWSVLAAQAARHMADVDTCNFSADAGQIGGQLMHMPGHAGGYLPPYFRSKMAGSTMDMAHAWGEGLAVHYVLSGDEGARESLERSGQWRLHGRFMHYDFRNARAAGWHLIHLCALARYGDDPRYLNAASIIVERVLERQSPGGGWEHQLTDAHCACAPPRCCGEAGFMVGVLLSGLRRYHELTEDPRVADAIVGGARWLVSRTYDPDAKHFRYTSCPNLGQASAVHTLQVIEGLAYGYNLCGDPELGSILNRALDDVGRPRSDLLESGFGKALCLETRYVPSLLAALDHRNALSSEASGAR